MTESSPLAIWGGVECTVNRVEDRYFDQMARSGHALRETDLSLFAELGLKTLRCGLIWERFEECGSWEWTDARMAEIRRLDLNPIAGLLHHGSGPRHTSLLDPDFPAKLCRYAEQVAQRFPWIDAYTPVNEPLTTARFSTLYGWWYPHHRSDRSFCRALYNELKGTVLAMKAIRAIQPAAQLVQTEDVGKTWSTAPLADLCSAREDRRWLALDLLCGHVDRHHPLFSYLRRNGLSEGEIFWFDENRCPPEIVGVNYYPTSDRFLDHRLALYPEWLAGGEQYVDIEAVRILPEGIAGVSRIVRETFERYELPVAVTEVHLGGPAEEQIRWLVEAWEGCRKLRGTGVDVRAICVWALLGSFDWAHLVRRESDHYEAGPFAVDGAGGEPYATELAAVVKQLARGTAPHHPALRQRGWWHAPERLLYPIQSCDERSSLLESLTA